MTSFKIKTCILAAVAGVLAAGTSAFADDSTAQLQKEVSELQSKVAELQAHSAANGKEVAATIEAVLRDAEMRSQSMAAMTGGAGYDNGFFIKTGDFSLMPGIIFQFWNVTDYREGTGGSKSDEIENGFEVHRVDLILQGTAFSKDLTYFFMWRTTPDDGSGLTLQDAFVTYMFSDAWGVRGGQFVENFTHEDWLSDGTQLAAERSLMDNTIGGFTNRTQGISMLYGNYNENNPWNAEFAFTDGSNSYNSNFEGHYPNNPGTVSGGGGVGNHAFDWGIYARAEYKASGKWSNYSDFTALGVKSDLLVFGLAGAYDQGGNGDLLSGTFDVQWKNTGGWAVYGALVARYGDADITGVGSGETTDWSALIQLSYLFNPSTEVFGRYTFLDLDNPAVHLGGASEDQFHEITIGVNYYLGVNGSAGHRAKVTVDLNFLPNGIPFGMTNLGYLGDNDFDTEVSLRAQFQLML